MEKVAPLSCFCSVDKAETQRRSRLRVEENHQSIFRDYLPANQSAQIKVELKLCPKGPTRSVTAQSV